MTLNLLKEKCIMKNKDEIIELLQEQNEKLDKISNTLSTMIAPFVIIHTVIFIFLFMIFMSTLLHL